MQVKVTVDALMELPVCDPWSRDRVEAAAERWPPDVSMLWIVEHGSASERDRVSLAMQWLLVHGPLEAVEVLRRVGRSLGVERETGRALEGRFVNLPANPIARTFLEEVRRVGQIAGRARAHSACMRALQISGRGVHGLLTDIADVLRERGS